MNEVPIVHEWDAGFTRKRRGERPARLDRRRVLVLGRRTEAGGHEGREQAQERVAGRAEGGATSTMKTAAGRSKDKEDLKKLKRIQRETTKM